MIAVKVFGIEQTIENIEQKKMEIEMRLPDLVYQAGQHLRSESVKEVPVDTGRLRASATVSPVKREGGRFYVEVGYGTDYAIYVHERTELRHRVGKAKFLEDPLKRNINLYRQWFKELVERILGGT